MKRSEAVKAMLICQEIRFPPIWTMKTLFSNQTSVLQLRLINCETVAFKIFDHFLLVNTRTF